MADINLRISKLRDTLFNGSNSEFARKIGMSESNIRGYTSNIEPKYRFFARCRECIPNLNMDWLIEGEGEMFKRAEICSNCGSVLYPNSPVNITTLEDNVPLCVNEEVTDYANATKHLNDYEHQDHSALITTLRNQIDSLHAKIIQLQEEQLQQQKKLLDYFSGQLSK